MRSFDKACAARRRGAQETTSSQVEPFDYPSRPAGTGLFKSCPFNYTYF